MFEMKGWFFLLAVFLLGVVVSNWVRSYLTFLPSV